MKILCIGMMVCDTTVTPIPDNLFSIDSTEIDPPVQSCGGDALNVAIAVARLACNVSICGKVGDDTNGTFLIEECRNSGVDVKGIRIDKEIPTPCSFALIDMRGERHFLSQRKMFGKLSNEDVPDQMIEEADVVYIGSLLAMQKMDEGGIESIFRKAHAHGAITVIDAAINDHNHADRDKYLPGIFKETDIFFPSMLEASAISHKSKPKEIAQYFAPFGMKYFGIKLGAEGSFATDFRTERYIGCPHYFPVVDTSGAGDSFMAGLLCGIVHGFDFYKSVEFASLIGSMNVSKKGAVGGVPTYEEAINQYRIWKSKEVINGCTFGPQL